MTYFVGNSKQISRFFNDIGVDIENVNSITVDGGVDGVFVHAYPVDTGPEVQRAVTYQLIDLRGEPLAQGNRTILQFLSDLGFDPNGIRSFRMRFSPKEAATIELVRYLDKPSVFNNLEHGISALRLTN